MEILLPQILFQVANFLILFFVFKKFIYKPVLKILENRATKIKEGLEAAEKNLRLQSDLQVQKDKSLADAKKQADTIVKDARKQAEKILSDAQIVSKKNAKQAIEKEKQAFEGSMARQTKQLEAKLAKTVSLATETILKNTLTVKLKSAVIDKQIKELSPSLFN